MSSTLVRIAHRRVELSSIAKYERQALAQNLLWSSEPFLLAELVFDSGKVISSNSLIRYFVKTLLKRVFGRLLKFP